MEPTQNPKAAAELIEGTSLTRDGLRRFRRNKMAMFCLALSLFMAVACIAPHLPFMPDAIREAYKSQVLEQKDAPPRLGMDARFWFGTDAVGRSIFWRILYGGQISFAVAFFGTVVSLIVGVSYGATAGYIGGRIDNAMMRFVDVLYGLPFMFLVIVAMTVLQEWIESNRPLFARYGLEDWAQSILLFAVLGMVQWLTMARIARGQVISLRQQEFVTAARTIGASAPRIIFRHIVPNLLGPVIVYTTLTIPGTMLQESFLSFLGLGVREPQCSWGSLASDGIQAFSPIAWHWWQLVFPCAALAITLFSLNFVGDGLRDALDPKGRR